MPDHSRSSGEKEINQMSLDQSKNLLRTKFYVPAVRPNQVSRPRLIDLLNEAIDRKHILVSAPAGYGKSTLVSTWIKETGIPSAWLSLDVGDNDPTRFLQYLLTAFQPVAPGIEDNIPDILRPAQYENIINHLTNQLASIPGPFVLVLDDFHVINTEAVPKIVSYLMEHLPHQVHLILLTRIDPPLPLSRLRVRDQLMDIRADQLCFTHDEIAAFLNDMMGLKLSADDLSAIETRTEGWIAGLQLAALSMQNCKDIHGFVSAFTGSHHYIMDYLIEEVIRLQPKKIGDFLMQTSILDHICGPLCESVIDADPEGPTDGQATLESLEKMNLFVIPLDDERRWYRYHHLFAEVLRKRLEQQYPGSLPNLHQRASRWFEQNGLVLEAIGHSLTAGDHDRAIQLIEQNGGLLLISGEVNTLANWIKAVEAQVRTRPWIHILKGWISAITGFPERVEEILQTAERMIASQEPPAGSNVMRGAIATARAYSAYQVGEPARAASFARQALEYLTDTDLTSGILRTIAAALLGDASAMNGELEEALQAYLRAKQIGQAAGDIHLVILVNCNLGDVLVEQGRLQEAMAIYSETLEMATRPDGKKLVIAGRVYGQLSRVSYEWNNLETATEQARQGITLCNYWGAPEYEAVGLVALARAEQVQGNQPAALEAMYSAERLVSEHLLLPKCLIWVNYTLARLWIAHGNFEKAARIVQASGLTIDDEILFLREPEFVVRLRLLLAQADYDTSLSLSKRLLEKAEAGKRIGRVIEVLILEALIFLGRQETEQALAVLKRALSLAKPERYIRTFVDEGEPMVKLLHLARSRKIETEYTTDLLSAVEKTAGIAQHPAKLLNEPLTAREMEVLKLIEAGCSNQEIAEKLVISFTTVKRHISNIYTKLDAKSRTQAIAIGKELKLFE